MTIPKVKEHSHPFQCRLCSKRLKKGTKIFEDSASTEGCCKPNDANATSPSKNLAGLILDCLKIKVTKEDKLPKYICCDCEKKLTSWLNFFTKSNEAQERLLQNCSVLVSEETSANNVCNVNETATVVLPIKEMETEGPKKVEPEKIEDTSEKTQEQVELKEDPTPSIHTCPVCKKSFSQRNKFAQHLAIHVTPEPETPHLWPCPVCPKKLRSCDGLARHQETHLESRNFCCHVCGRLFQTLTCLLNHVRVQHSPETGPGARPRHTCPICSRVFRQSTHMVQHLRTHTGERPYQCGECGSCFTTSGQLQRHSQAVHQGLKRFKCDLCGKEFLYSHNYKAHMQRHDGNKELHCDLCGKSFFTKNALFRHRRFHTGEKPFQCDICGKKFADCSNRKRHRLQHHKAAAETQVSEETSTSSQPESSSVGVVLMEPLEDKSVEEGGKTFTSLRTFLMEDFLRVELVTFDETQEVDDEDLALVRQVPSLSVVGDLTLHANDLSVSLVDPNTNDPTFSLEPDPVDMSSTLDPASPVDLSPSLQPMGRSPLHISPSLRNSPDHMSASLEGNPLDLSPDMAGSPLHIPSSDFLLTLHGY